MPTLTRGQLIRTGLAGSVLLALGACARRTAGTATFDAAHAYRSLSPADRDLMAALAGAMLAGALPSGGAAQSDALVATVRGVDVAVAGLTPRVAGELHRLFGLLEFGPSRAFTTGVWTSWPQASRGEVAGFLTRWRYSKTLLFRNGYQALHQLVMAAWYGNAASWPRIGYPGPPAIS